MSILVDKNTRVVTQGITGATGQIHTRACKEYGTQMVAGVVPGKGGTTFEGIPIFDTVEQARKATGCNASVSYVPPAFAADGILELRGQVARGGDAVALAVERVLAGPGAQHHLRMIQEILIDRDLGAFHGQGGRL